MTLEPPDDLYVGSPYHKRYPSEWGAPALQSHKTECPEEVDPEDARNALNRAIGEALRSGSCSILRDGSWPRYAWGRTSFPAREGDDLVIVWEARVVNRTRPAYKAYPVQPERHNHLMPPRVKERLWPDR
jgi:hypothetical protein